MGRKIDEAQVRSVARLARLELGDEDIERFAEQLSAILEYFEKLDELDTSTVEPLAHCLPIHNVFRDDVPRPSLATDAALHNAPERAHEYFKVPKILDDASGA